MYKYKALLIYLFIYFLITDDLTSAPLLPFLTEAYPPADEYDYMYEPFPQWDPGMTEEQYQERLCPRRCNGTEVVLVDKYRYELAYRYDDDDDVVHFYSAHIHTIECSWRLTDVLACSQKV
jgi:hypothetical protein